MTNINTNTKKYMVIDCCEREIGEPEFFDTLKEAQLCVFEKFLEACRHIDANDCERYTNRAKEGLEEAVDSLIEDDILDDENNFTDTSAWAETYNHDNWDCRIIEVEI